MAEGDGKKRKSSKMLLLGGALAAAAAAGAYLSDCIPGMKFGAGSGSDAPADDKAEAAEKVDEESVDPNAPITVTVSDTQCKRGDGELGDCDALCKELQALDDIPDVIIDDTTGVHKTVLALTDCLKEANVSVKLAD